MNNLIIEGVERILDGVQRQKNSAIYATRQTLTAKSTKCDEIKYQKYKYNQKLNDIETRNSLIYAIQHASPAKKYIKREIQKYKNINHRRPLKASSAFYSKQRTDPNKNTEIYLQIQKCKNDKSSKASKGYKFCNLPHPTFQAHMPRPKN